MKQLWAIRNSNTKEYVVDQDDRRILFNYNKEWCEQFIKDHPDQCYDSEWNILTDLEVIEWIEREDFYFVCNNFTIHGNAEVDRIEVLTFKMEEDDCGYPTPAYDECGNHIYEFVNKTQVILGSGVAIYGFHEPTDEGYHAETYYVKEGVDKENQPVWKIRITIDSKDCDGKMERIHYYQSKGGRIDLDQEAERYFKNNYSTESREDIINRYKKDYDQKRFESKLMPDNTEKNTQRDFSAEAMGY